MRPLLVLRPEPGNGATAARARALGLDVRQYPLFQVTPVAWTAPDPRDFDFLLLTSANALRCGGSELERLKNMGALAVGPITAAAAREAGFELAKVGSSGVDDLLAKLPASSRLLHLAGREHRRPHERHHVETVEVYRATALDVVLPTEEFVALVHSARAGARLAELAIDRSPISVAAISGAAAAACGTGWAASQCIDRPDEASLLALAAWLCQD